MTALAPVALFVYNRPEHTRRTVEALAANELARDTDLIVFSDAARDASAERSVDGVRAYVRSIRGFRSVEVHERATNAGLAGSIINGVTRICEASGRVIVLEDDLVTSPWFLRYMNDGLRVYEHDDRVASVHGYSYPVVDPLPETFFLRGADCWGWATWARAWRTFREDGKTLMQELTTRGLLHQFDLDGSYGFSDMLAAQIAGRNNSWAVRWHASCFLNDMLTLYPGRSLVSSIGTDASGVHCALSDEFVGRTSDEPVVVNRIALLEHEMARESFAAFLRGVRPSLLRRALNRFSRSVRRKAGGLKAEAARNESP